MSLRWQGRSTGRSPGVLQDQGYTRGMSLVAVSRLYLLGEFGHHLSIDEGVHVTTQHVEDPPVANVCLASDSFGHLQTDVSHQGKYGGFEKLNKQNCPRKD